MIGATTLNQTRGADGDIFTVWSSIPFSVQNLYFTLTNATVTSFTVPAGPALVYTMIIKSVAPIYVLPAATPTLTGPTTTPTATLAQLCVGEMARQVSPGQTIQILTSTVGTPNYVGIEFYTTRVNGGF